MENKNLKDSFCQTCDLQFDNKTIFDLHLSVVHNVDNLENKHGNKMVAIKKEENGVISYSKHTTSSEKLYPKGKRKFDCNICGKDFKQNSNLERHIDTVHEGKKSHVCSICNVNFATERSLKIHKSSIHEGKKPYKCSICKASFSQISSKSSKNMA